MKTLQQLSTEALDRDPAVAAVEFERRWYTWGQLRDGAANVRALLEQSGVDAGAAVTFVARNRPSALAALLALLAGGHDIRMLYPFQSAAGLARQVALQQAGASSPAAVIAAEGDFSEELVAVLRQHGVAGIALSGVGADLVGGCEQCHVPGAGGDGRSPKIEILTSGTTGMPKPFPVPYSLVETFMIGDALRSGDRPDCSGQAPALLYFPIGNITGIHTTVPPLIKGQRIVLLEKFDLREWHRFVKEYRPQTSGIPPAAMAQLLDANIPPEDLRSLQSMGSGAAPLDPSMHREFERRYNIPILLSYGATEFGGPVTGWSVDLYREFGASRFGSVGRVFPGGFRARVVDPDSRRVLPAGEEGLLEIVSPRIGSHWIVTSDLAVIDGEGFVFLRGRADGAIMRGGFKVLPETVEEALLLHPAVAAASVVGVPDSRLSEVPAAAVQLRYGVPGPQVEELAAHLRQHLLATHIPVHWEFVASLPKTPSFKIDRLAVRRLFTPVAAGAAD